MNDFRELLQKLEADEQRSFDTTVITLSGGALGLSFAFIKDFAPLDAACHVWLLLCAWLSWAVSISVILTSHLIAARALRERINELDGKADEGTSDRWDRWTGRFNWTGAVSFVFGVILLVIFVGLNLGKGHERKETAAAATTGTGNEGHPSPVSGAAPTGRESGAASPIPTTDAAPAERQEVAPSEAPPKE